MRYAFYASGFQFESHLADFGFVFFSFNFPLLFFLICFSSGLHFTFTSYVRLGIRQHQVRVRLALGQVRVSVRLAFRLGQLILAQGWCYVSVRLAQGQLRLGQVQVWLGLALGQHQVQISRVRLGLLMVMVKVRFRVYLLHLVRFYQAYCTLIMRYCHATEGGRIRLQI